MYIIAGLGNPGKEYERTRHNMGYRVVDEIARRYSIDIGKEKFNSMVGEGFIAGHKVMLVKPLTYMNRSGEAIRDIVNFYKLPMENLFVVYDDFDIPEGAIRIRKKGSSGSHNGMKSIIYQVQSDRFPRMRVGIGAPETGEGSGNASRKIIGHVIGRMSADDLSRSTEYIEKAADAAVSVLTDGIDNAMNRFNSGKKRIVKREEDEK